MPRLERTRQKEGNSQRILYSYVVFPRYDSERRALMSSLLELILSIGSESSNLSSV